MAPLYLPGMGVRHSHGQYITTSIDNSALESSYNGDAIVTWLAIHIHSHYIRYTVHLRIHTYYSIMYLALDVGMYDYVCPDQTPHQPIGCEKAGTTPSGRAWPFNYRTEQMESLCWSLLWHLTLCITHSPKVKANMSTTATLRRSPFWDWPLQPYSLRTNKRTNGIPFLDFFFWQQQSLICSRRIPGIV